MVGRRAALHEGLLLRVVKRPTRGISINPSHPKAGGADLIIQHRIKSVWGDEARLDQFRKVSILPLRLNITVTQLVIQVFNRLFVSPKNVQAARIAKATVII